MREPSPTAFSATTPDGTGSTALGPAEAPARASGGRTRQTLGEDPVEVGRRIRALREERGISLSALAKRAGIGKATLSGLETGVRNPTLETLYAVTGQLGVPLAAVLSPPAAGDPHVDAPVVVHGAAVEATLLEVFEDPDATYELYRIRIRAGAAQVSPAHPAGVTEHLTVFRGEVTAGPVGAPLRTGAGGYLRWAADTPHTYAAGAEDVEAGLLIRSPRHA
ncbi:XRE family transcriptional regulator [Cryptosporangium minutisporangium]|uniref:XRE family transcriptional regulator n=1 Tax=Cryptosporangium minutisporangium TaxID=113569 RepID=A0ABP6T6C7_9ACTN